MKSLLNLLSFKFFTYTGLHPKILQAKRELTVLQDKMWELFCRKKETYLQAKAEGTLHERRLNLIDVMIEDNLKHPDNEMWDKRQVIAHIGALQLAGADSTYSMTKTFLDFLSRNPEILKQVE